MLKRIVARDCSIAELFSGSLRFILPYFQRGYAWQQQHVDRLLGDVLDAVDGKFALDWYPLGSIIVANSDGSGEARLADGHQRLITLTILISALRDLEEDETLRRRLHDCIFAPGPDGTSREPRLLTQSSARDCLAHYVQAEGATAQAFDSDIEDLADSEANILRNRDRVKKALVALEPLRRQQVARFLLDSCIVIVMEVASEHVARLLFATMHDTGIKPSATDLFKADVLGTIPPDAREAGQTAWEGLEARLGGSSLDLLLRQIAIIAERKIPKGQVEPILQRAFRLETPDGAGTFVETRLGPLGSHMADILGAPLGAGSLAPAAQRRLQYLSWVRNHDTWQAVVLHWLDVAGDNVEATVTFLTRLEALAWTEMIAADEPVQRDERYLRLLAEISSGTVLNGNSSLMIDRAQREAVRTNLAAPNFTRRRYKQFLLLRADAAIRGEDRVHQPPTATIEHIYPNRPGANSQWSKDFRGPDAGELRQTLGNLTLLTVDEQNDAKNKDFGAKREVFRGSDFALARDLARFDTWTPAAVRQRTSDLVETLMKAWHLA